MTVLGVGVGGRLEPESHRKRETITKMKLGGWQTRETCITLAFFFWGGGSIPQPQTFQHISCAYHLQLQHDLLSHAHNVLKLLTVRTWDPCSTAHIHKNPYVSWILLIFTGACQAVTVDNRTTWCASAYNKSWLTRRTNAHTTDI